MPEPEPVDPRHRVQTSFWLHLLGLVCVYTLVLGLLPLLEPLLPASSTYVSLPLQVLFVAGTLRFIRRNRVPTRALGLHLEGAGRHALGGCATAVPLCAVVIAVKVLWVRHGGDGPVFELPELLREHGLAAVLAWVAAYFASSVAQELVVRGGVQQGLALYMNEERHPLTAVLAANVLFGLTHLHVSAIAAGIAFVVGLVWGLQTWRDASVVGATVSHMLVGTVTFFVVGVGV